MQFRALTWTAIVSFGLFCSAGLLTRAEAFTADQTILFIDPLSVTIPAGDNVMFTAKLLDNSADVFVANETIDFTNVTTSTFLGSEVTGSNGVTPALSVVFPTAGSFDIQATFNGDTNGTPNLMNASPVDASVTVTTPTTPLPAALPLFATGIGGLGLLGWRRKRKARAGA